LLSDGPIYQRETLVHYNKKGFSVGSAISGYPDGPMIDNSEWQKLKLEAVTHFKILEEINNFIVLPEKVVGRSDLIRCLTLALLWFHEACRETDDLIATAKFASCLDTLGSGVAEKGILKVIESRLNIKPDDKIHTDGHTLKQVIKTIYGKGRSQTFHGSNSEIFADWSEYRSTAEHIARLTLLSCLDFSTDNRESTTAKELSQ
jgi:hypothetical protein